MNKKLLFGFVLLICLTSFVFSLVEIEIDVENSFEMGETVNFKYDLLSSKDEQVVYTPRIKCINGFESILYDGLFDLKKDILVTKKYEGFEVTEEMEPQQCLAVIEIKKPFIQVREEVFEIVTKPFFSLKIKTCEDKLCSSESKTFLKNDKVYIDYISDVDDPLIAFTLEYPDGSSEQIPLPTSIKAKKVGTYNLEVTASKEGYKSLTKKLQFGVIKEHAKIKSVPFCNLNGICEGSENYQACPKDCTREWKPFLSQLTGEGKQSILEKYESNKLLIVLALAVIFIGGIIFVYFKIKYIKPKNKNFLKKQEKNTKGKVKGTDFVRLENYIKLQIKKGVPKKQIMDKLLSRGWKKERVEKVYNAVKSKSS